MGSARRSSRGLLHDTRGAAYAETLLVMPVFISLFAGIGFFHHYYSERLDAGRQARRCAWAFANGGCEDVPPDCVGVVSGSRNQAQTGSPTPSNPEMERDVADAEQALGTLDDRIPVPGAQNVIQAILGTTTSAQAQRDVPLPGWVGGGNRRATCGYALLCNEKERTMGDVVREAFCSAVRKFGAGLLCGG